MFGSETRLGELREQPTDALAAEYTRLDALEASVRAERLLVLAVLDERGIDPGDGALDTDGWVAAQSRVNRATARADVEAARSLREQPAIADAAISGLLSRDQLAPLTQLASTQTDAQWAADAPGLSPQYLAREVRKQQVVTTDQAAARRAHPAVWWRADRRAGRTKVYADLPDTDGAKLVRALERRAEQIGPREDGTWAPYEEQCAEALVALASQELANDADPDRATIVIHTPAAALSVDDVPGCELTDLDLPVASETVRRLACDANVQWIAEALGGEPIGVGRRSRTVPRWLDRLVRYRDRHCRFPGCDRRRGAEVHHIVHWAHGGTTDYLNLILLCPRHHTFLHEYRWSVRGNPSLPADLVFLRPDGTQYRAGEHRSGAHPSGAPPSGDGATADSAVDAARQGKLVAA